MTQPNLDANLKRSINHTVPSGALEFFANLFQIAYDIFRYHIINFSKTLNAVGHLAIPQIPIEFDFKLFVRDVLIFSESTLT